MFRRVGRDILSFVSGRDLVVFAVGIALSNQMQITIKTLIDNLIMPFVSKLTGADNLANRSIHLKSPDGKDLGIKIGWGAALQSVIIFAITLVVMVEMARYITVHYVKSSSVQFV